MKSLIPLLSLSTLLTLAACSSHVNSTYQVLPSPLDSAIEGRTRTEKLYFQFDTILILDATLIDTTVRDYWVEETIAGKRLPADQAAALRGSERLADDESVSFLLALYTADDEWNALSGSAPLWRLTLNGEQGAVAPSLIRKVSYDTLRYRDHLPYNPSFRKFYLVNFPRSVGIDRPITLVMGSDLGQVTLTWP